MAQRAGTTNLPLHGGQVPRWLADRMTRLGALKRGLAPLDQELGIHVCGGRGRYSRQTPHELIEIGRRVGFDEAALATVSRLVAKVDSAALQDGFQLYLHGFIVTDDGHWVVVQQGMNGR